MNRIKLLGRLMELKSGKRLIVFAVVTSLTAAVIMFFVVLFLNRYSKLKLLDQYIHEVPGIVKSREDVLEKRSKVFEEDALTRGELGSFIYSEESELSVKDRLEYVRSSVSADSVSLIDESGEVLNTTGIVLPSEAFEEALGTLSVREPQLKVYPALSDDEDSTENMAGKAMVMLPALCAFHFSVMKYHVKMLQDRFQSL